MQDPVSSVYSKQVLGSFLQKFFDGGINLISSDTALNDSEYVWLVNGRQRFGYIEPNKRNKLIDAPSGIKQGIISIGNILILFVSGKAYYHEDGTTIRTQIPSFQMSSSADKV